MRVKIDCRRSKGDFGFYVSGGSPGGGSGGGTPQEKGAIPNTSLYLNAVENDESKGYEPEITTTTLNGGMCYEYVPAGNAVAIPNFIFSFNWDNVKKVMLNADGSVNPTTVSSHTCPYAGSAVSAIVTVKKIAVLCYRYRKVYYAQTDPVVGLLPWEEYSLDVPSGVPTDDTISFSWATTAGYRVYAFVIDRSYTLRMFSYEVTSDGFLTGMADHGSVGVNEMEIGTIVFYGGNRFVITNYKPRYNFDNVVYGNMANNLLQSISIAGSYGTLYEGSACFWCKNRFWAFGGYYGNNICTGIINRDNDTVSSLTTCLTKFPYNDSVFKSARVAATQVGVYVFGWDKAVLFRFPGISSYPEPTDTWFVF